MKHLIVLILTIVLSNNITAQNFQGKAIYKSFRQVNIAEMRGVSAENQKKVKTQLEKNFQNEYTLNFDKEESVFSENEKLEVLTPYPRGGNIVVVRDRNFIYKNLKEDRYTNQSDIFGKQFLIKDKLRQYKWELTEATKNIGVYTCYKAYYNEEYLAIYLNSEREEVTVTRTRLITAWYTPQIPVSNGPESYGGLPGLILEVNNGRMTLICNKIIMNPEDKITISEPKKGKVVTQAEFDKIRQKKEKEMMENGRLHNTDGVKVLSRSHG